VPGAYYESCKLSKASKAARDKENMQHCWDSTVQMLETELHLLALKKTFKLIPHGVKNLYSFIGKQGDSFYYDADKSADGKEDDSGGVSKSPDHNSQDIDDYYNEEWKKSIILSQKPAPVQIEHNRTHESQKSDRQHQGDQEHIKIEQDVDKKDINIVKNAQPNHMMVVSDRSIDLGSGSAIKEKPGKEPLKSISLKKGASHGD